MQITYLDEFHLINQSILEGSPSLVKVGVVGTGDLAKFKKLYPQSKIIAYEADRRNYLAYSKTSKDVVSKFHNKAVGNDGKVTLYRFTNKVSNSVYARHKSDPNCVLKDKVEVKSVSVKTILKENKLNYLDVLILNCEGGELPIMREMKKKTIREKIGQICVSFHDPRIYPPVKKEKILGDLAPFYHIIRGSAPYIPDYLLIRKV